MFHEFGTRNKFSLSTNKIFENLFCATPTGVESRDNYTNLRTGSRSCCRKSFSPKGLYSTAQGNALGLVIDKTQALKGRNIWSTSMFLSISGSFLCHDKPSVVKG